MATDVRTVAPDNTSDATFRAWAQAMDAAILAVGLVAASDTGQVDLTTMTRPAVANTAAGYKMYRFNDALQATAPVFIKLEFGVGGTATTSTAAWVTVGTATNGAGTLTGQVGTRSQLLFTTTTTASQCFTSGSSSRLTMMFWVTSASQKAIIVVERLRDSTGAETGDGVFTHVGYGTTLNSHQVIPASGIILALVGITPIYWANGQSLIRGANTNVLPGFPWLAGWLNPLLSYVGCWIPDIAVDTIFPVQMYGVSHNYRCLTNAGGSTSWGGQGATSNGTIAMLWE